MTVKKKRFIIIVLWLISLIIFYFVIRGAVFKICEKNRIAELLYSTKSIPDVARDFIENDDFTINEINANHEARINGLALALGNFETIKSAEDFLKNYKEAGGIEALAVYDKDDNLVYNDGFEDENDEDSENVYYHNAGSRWTVKIKYGFTEKEKDLEYLNNWSRKLANVIVGEDGCILAVDPKNDRVLSFIYGTDGTIKDLDIKYEGKTLDYEFLKTLFGKAGQVHKIEVENEILYGTRIKYGNMYLIAMIPQLDIFYDADIIVVNFMIVLALFTGLVMFFLFFTLTDSLKEGDPSKYRKPSEQLFLGMIISLLLIFFLSGWVELLDMFMDKYRDCEDKAEYITSKLVAADTFEAIWKSYTDAEYLSKCLMVKSIIEATDHPLQERDLNRISKSIGVDYISVYDENGKSELSNSPYVAEQITKDSDFYPLLKGSENMVQEPEEDAVSGNYIQYFGACLRSDSGEPNGFVRIEMDLTDIKTMQERVGFDNIIKQGNMYEGSFFALINKESEMFQKAALIKNSEDYASENEYDSVSMEDGNYEEDYGSYAYYLFGEGINLREDYSNMSVEDAGLSKDVLTPDYSGIQTMKDRDYYAYSMRIYDDICLVMREKSRIGLDNAIPVLLTTVFAFFSMALMVVVFIQPGNAIEEEKYSTELSDEKKPENIETFSDMFYSLFDKGKPFFEIRWPDDSVAWSDKSASGKRKSIVRGIILAFVVLIIGQQLFFNTLNDDSIWYYVLSPNWSSGVNIITVTKSGIAILIIIAASFILHKILFFIARASGSHVETICHLLNSFIKYASFLTSIFMCISILGVNKGFDFSISAGVVSVIISIACQSIFADIFAGIFMVFEGTVTAGETVYFNDRYGTILSIGIRTTQILRFSELLVVRNSEFKNYVAIPSNQYNRLTTSVNIDLNEPLAHVESIILNEMKGMHKRFVKLTDDENVKGPEYMGVQKISDHGIALQFAIHTKGLYRGRVARELNRELKMMFERNNIRFAMPQIVVNNPVEHEAPPETDNYPEPIPGVMEQQKE
ncbi:mechanosensitive ion channel domain-containing protein [Butyrivibrio sp. JL13D10]|uniref:mechanosensitive ion channel domain-containing protein n=1 Tax=Butyrivibrio sp. JL13D10 TaxID=3236815 RepID=UPI0038B42B55